MFASAGSFVLGAIIPLAAVMLPTGVYDVPVTFGAIAMLVTYAIGNVFHIAGV